MSRILDVFGKDIEAIDLCCKPWRDGCLGWIPKFCNFPRSPGGVRTRPGEDPPRAQEIAALAQPHDVAVRGLDGLKLRAFKAHQLEADRHEVLGDDVQRRGRQQVMDIRHAARNRVLHRDHRQLCLAAGRRLEHVLERRTRQGLKVRIDLPAGDVGVGAQLPLERDLAHGGFYAPPLRKRATEIGG